jgi:hypothetical protein
VDKWDLQGEALSLLTPGGLSMPPSAGRCVFEKGVLINRVKANWALIWCLAPADPDGFRGFAYTDVTEVYALLGLAGREVFAILEKVTDLDLSDRAKHPPFMELGPVLGVRSQVVVLERGGDRPPRVLIACERGYGQCMADSLLRAGREWGLQPDGSKVL